MINLDHYAGHHIALFGLGLSGVATAKALLEGGAHLYAWDDDERMREAYQARGLELYDLNEADWSIFDMLILAPGVPLTHPEPHWTVRKAHAHGVDILGDVALFSKARELYEASQKDDRPHTEFIAITGTNGKSTTTQLLSHCLEAAGFKVSMGGNIGKALLSLEPFEAGRLYVIECSSYQIDLAPDLRPSLGLHLNLSEDHLERHGHFENYAAIKERLVQQADFAVIGVDDDASKEIYVRVHQAKAHQCVAISACDHHDGDFFAKGAKIYKKGEASALFDLSKHLCLRGAHNMQNVCAVVAAMVKLGVDVSLIERGLLSFTGLAHRMQPLGAIDGVLCVNDSKATNIDAAIRALSSFDHIYWIAGGRAKGNDLSALAPHLGAVQKAYLIGEAEALFAGFLSDHSIAYKKCGTLENAFRAALKDALAEERADKKGVVLLSPACASFDHYRNFELRGAAFEDAFRAFQQNDEAL